MKEVIAIMLLGVVISLALTSGVREKARIDEEYDLEIDSIDRKTDTMPDAI